MSETTNQRILLLGSIEPHAPLLSIPPDGQLLYKVMTIENLLRSIVGNYLHFNRVDSYADFSGADIHDGRQLPKDLLGNTSAKFAKNTEFSAADYYDKSRNRTYACCFSLENSDFIWNNYANGSSKGKVCVAFEFGKLRAMLNQTLKSENTALEYDGNRIHQIFSLNYGIIKYVEWDVLQANTERLPNPIQYTYWKDNKKFSEEKELRISLSTLGIGQFVLDGSTMPFPSSLQFSFDFKTAITNHSIQQILYAPDSDSRFLQTELHKLGILVGKNEISTAAR